MFCTKCGNKLEDGAVFCDECGAKIERKQQPAVAQNQNYQTQQSQSSPAGEALNNAFNTTKQTIDKLGLDGTQKLLCIFSAVSALFALITCNVVYNWVTLICAVFMCYLCVKKEPYNTKLMALPITVYFAKELLYYVFHTIPTLKYQQTFAIVLGILMFLLDIAVVVFYWLVVTNKTEYKRIFLWVILITLAINIFGILLNFVLGYVFRFLTVLYYLSMGLFMASYIVMIFKAENDCLIERYK